MIAGVVFCTPQQAITALGPKRKKDGGISCESYVQIASESELDVIWLMKCSVKPQSAWHGRSVWAPRANVPIYVWHAVHVSSKVISSAAHFASDTNNKIIQIYGLALIYLRCLLRMVRTT